MFREDNSHTHTHTHTHGEAEVMNVFRKLTLDTIKLNKTHKASCYQHET